MPSLSHMIITAIHCKNIVGYNTNIQGIRYNTAVYDTTLQCRRVKLLSWQHMDEIQHHQQQKLQQTMHITIILQS